MTENYDYEMLKSYTLNSFFVFSLLCLYSVTNMIKKLGLHLLVTFIFNKDEIWRHWDEFAQNRYAEVENSLYQCKLNVAPDLLVEC